MRKKKKTKMKIKLKSMKTLINVLRVLFMYLMALIVSKFTNSGVDLLVYTWVAGTFASLFTKEKLFYLIWGAIIATTAYVLICSGKWDWRWFDIILTIVSVLRILGFSKRARKKR